jgi:immune inhibitor A
MGIHRRARVRLALVVGAVMLPSIAVAASHIAAAPPPIDRPAGGTAGAPSDELPNPLEEQRRARRDEAITAVLNGEATVEQRGASTVVNLADVQDPQARARDRAAGHVDKYVELGREKTDKIFVILAEFGNQRDPRYPDQDTDPDTPGPVRFDGPLHNEIPEPDRSVDNRTIWSPDFSRQHYQELYFGTDTESVKTYYEAQSSGRYSVDGQVSDWVKVPFNEARYGRSGGFPCDSNVCSNTWALIRDAINQWYADQLSAGRSVADITADLRSYDQWDRYDYDGDGNFNEPDGYLDHFQIVHAGGDESDGDPWQGEDAIWSHRWYAFLPDPNHPSGPPQNELGGTPIGTTGIWVGDYTIQPENGGLDVFAHEYGHDLGLPDLYDTAAGPNPVEWWSIMAQSRVSAAGEPVGTRAADLGPWEKLQLGWLDYEVIPSGQTRTLNLGPHEYNTRLPQGVVVPLPKRAHEITFGAPAEGESQYWSDTGNDLENTMSTTLDLPAGTEATLSFTARWNIEDCGPDPCDYAYVEVDDGSGWTPIAGNITNADEGNGIDGVSDGDQQATFDLSAYAGTSIGLRIRYSTDGAVAGTDPDLPAGIFVDAVTVDVDGTVVLSDGAEDPAASPWTLDGFRVVGTSETVMSNTYYIVSNREYISFDQYLRTGPYNFGFPDKPDWAEHFPYQDGLLIWYWDDFYTDNNVSEHPFEGMILPIDSHPQAIYNLTGQPWRSRIQIYDAPFGLQKADSFTLHIDGIASYIRGQNAQPLFDDSRQYYDPAVPTAGVNLIDTNTRIRVLAENGTSVWIRISQG